eukprot:CAMPEP_0167744692 /NCGR_PEP_ID=MMETSP0110_2-20121227/2733_1 /TAXON_ID=629695 /ORGANISM="Gymnochlora sp., Strain CCMP2014" /LENGTH=2012 /DNA_ID=CAMNT_0007629243 /DNA_START=90 /DNA_END=6128 /DNA_ORIENTATION=+
MRRLDTKEPHSFVIPPEIKEGYNEKFRTPQLVSDLYGLYRRHSRLTKITVPNDALTKDDLAEFNMLVKLNHLRDMEDDVELSMYICRKSGEAITETFQISIKKNENGKNFGRDYTSWVIFTNIFPMDLDKDDLHLVINTITVRPSLKAGGKRVAGVKFRQPYGVSVLHTPARELMQMISSWGTQDEGIEAEIKLDMIMAPEQKFNELPKIIINGGDTQKFQNVKGEIMVTMTMWYGNPYPPTLPKDANFTQVQNLLQHFVASSQNINKRKRLGDPSNPRAAQINGLKCIGISDRKFGPNMLLINTSGASSPIIDTKGNSRGTIRVSRQNSGLKYGTHSASSFSRINNLRSPGSTRTPSRTPKSASRRVDRETSFQQKFTLDKSSLRGLESDGPQLNLDYVTVVPRRPLHNVLPMGESINGMFVTLGLANTEKLFTKSMKKAPKNVLAKVTLRENKSRKPYGGAIASGLGKTITCQPEYNSIVYYHNNSPLFNERILIMLPPEFDQCHVHVEFFHCSSSKPPEPLGFAFTRLVRSSSGTFLTDGDHTLAINKYSRKSGESGQNTDYLQPLKKDLARGSIVLATRLCSDSSSQNPRIHWFLNYKKSADPQKALRGVLDVPLTKIEPLLRVFLDTLFSIFVENDESLHLPALEVLVFILGLSTNPDHEIPELTTNLRKANPKEDRKGAGMTDARLRAVSAFKYKLAPKNESYIPIFQIVDHWIETRLQIVMKQKGVIAIQHLLSQWRALLEWACTEEAQKDTKNIKWNSVMYALRSSNTLIKIVIKLIPFGMSDEECKASKVLMRIFEIRTKVRMEVIRVTKATAMIISSDGLPYLDDLRRYVIDRAAIWLGAVMQCFSEEDAVIISHDFVLALLKISEEATSNDKRLVKIGLHYLQFIIDLEQEGIFTSPGFCSDMLLPILESLHFYMKSDNVAMKVLTVEVLDVLLPILITGMKAEDSSAVEDMILARKTRTRSRSSRLQRLLEKQQSARSSRANTGDLEPRDSRPLGTRAGLSLPTDAKGHTTVSAPRDGSIVVRTAGSSQLRMEPTHHPRLKGVIKVKQDQLIKLTSNLFPALLDSFTSIRSKEGSHSYLYFFDNKTPKLKEAVIKIGIAVLMLGNLVEIYDTPSSSFESCLELIEEPSQFLGKLMKAAEGLVTKGSLFDSRWIQLRLCELKFIQGVMQQSSSWAMKELNKLQPRETVVDEAVDDDDTGGLSEELNDFCKQYWRLAVCLLMCPDLQLERQPSRKAAYISAHVKDMRQEIIQDMQRMQQTMGKDWARYHRTLFPPLLKTSIMQGERSGAKTVRALLFNLVLHLWKLYKDFKPALHITVDVATDLVMKLSQLRQSHKLARMNKAHELRNVRWCALGLCSDDVPWMSLAAQVKMHPLILSIQELFTMKLKHNLKEYMIGEAKALPDTIAALRVEKKAAVSRSEYKLAQRLHDELLRLEQQERDQTSGDQMFIEQFNSYCSDIAQYFQFLVIAIRIPRSAQYEDDGIDVCVWLIQFLKKIGKKQQCSQVYDMFSQMHSKFKNGTEQGNALLEYADFLSWEGKDQKKKFKLLAQAHKVFNTANSLAQCVQVCKRLALAHEMYSLKFMDVALTLRLQADYFKTLSSKDQITARYYRVFFVGRGLPAHLRGKSYVYRSGSATKLISVAEFTNSIKGFFPGAKVVNSTEPPKLKLVRQAVKENVKWRQNELKNELANVTKEIARVNETDKNLMQVKLQEISKALADINEAATENESPEDSKLPEVEQVKNIIEESPYLKLIQITTLTVSNKKEMEGSEHHLRKVEATMRHKRYHYGNKIEVFFYQRVLRPTSLAVKQFCEKRKVNVPPQGEKRNEYRDLWVQRNYVIVQEPMPAVRRRVPITAMRKVMYTPLHNAIITLRDKNEEISSSVLGAVDSKERNDLVPLTQNLSGVIDAAVAGGIANYIAAFFDGTYIQAIPTEAPLIAKFKETLEEQLEILSKGLQVFHKKLDSSGASLKPLYQHLQASYSKMVVQLAKGILKRDISRRQRK